MNLDAEKLKKGDGRQSPRALAIQRGVGRYLKALDFSYVAELTLPDERRADMVGLGPKGEIWIIEIKSSVADFNADRKWPDYRVHCDRFFFATLPDVPASIFPETAGLIVADEFGAELLRDDVEDRLAAHIRKSLTFKIARFASKTLVSWHDPASSIQSVT